MPRESPKKAAAIKQKNYGSIFNIINQVQKQMESGKILHVIKFYLSPLA